MNSLRRSLRLCHNSGSNGKVRLNFQYKLTPLSSCQFPHSVSDFHIANISIEINNVHSEFLPHFHDNKVCEVIKPQGNITLILLIILIRCLLLCTALEIVNNPLNCYIDGFFISTRMCSIYDISLKIELA